MSGFCSQTLTEPFPSVELCHFMLCHFMQFSSPPVRIMALGNPASLIRLHTAFGKAPTSKRGGLGARTNQELAAMRRSKDSPCARCSAVLASIILRRTVTWAMLEAGSTPTLRAHGPRFRVVLFEALRKRIDRLVWGP